jgi:hypothetical protein
MPFELQVREGFDSCIIQKFVTGTFFNVDRAHQAILRIDMQNENARTRQTLRLGLDRILGPDVNLSFSHQLFVDQPGLRRNCRTRKRNAKRTKIDSGRFRKRIQYKRSGQQCTSLDWSCSFSAAQSWQM